MKTNSLTIFLSSHTKESVVGVDWQVMVPVPQFRSGRTNASHLNTHVKNALQWDTMALCVSLRRGQNLN